jgi:hypothetical protein
MVGNWLAGPSKMDFVEAFMGGPVLSKLFVRYNTLCLPVPPWSASSAGAKTF